MLITSLELHNIKSYDDSGVPIFFKPGVNLICGPNGSGKSTILESIGFALFGALDYKQAQLCREGEEKGQIVLTFESPLDQRRYQVVRGVGRSTLRIQDPATKSWLTRSKKNSEDWLSEQFEIDLAYAKELFSTVIGVSQGKMTGSFLESARVRKLIFNPLLRVEEYETAWGKLRDTNRYLADQLQEANKLVARLEGRLERLPQVQQQVKKLAVQMVADRAELKESDQRLDELEVQLFELGSAQKKVEKLAKQLEDATRQLATLEGQIERAEQELQAAEEAATIVAENRGGYVAYQDAMQQRNELESERKERDKRLKVLRVTEKKLTKVQTTLNHIAESLASVAQAEARVVELAPLVEQQTALEAQVRAAETQVAARERARERAAEETRRVGELNKALKKIRTQLAKRKKIEQDLSTVAEERTSLTEQLNELAAQIEPLRSQRHSLEGDLRRAEGDKRDFKNAQKRLTDEQASLKHQQADLARVEAQLQERTQLEQELDKFAQAIASQQAEHSAAEAEEAQCKEMLKTLKKRLEMLRGSQSADCPVCNRPLDEHRAHELEEEFKLEQKGLKKRQSGAKKRKQVVVKELKRLQREQKVQQATFNKLPAAGRAQELRQSISQQNTQIEKWNARVNSLAGALERLKTSQAALHTLDQTLASLNEQLKSRQQTRDQLDKQRNKLNRQLAKLPQPARADELSADIEQAEAQKARFESQVEQLADAPTQLGRIQVALAKLADPRTKQASQQAIADQRPKLEKQQKGQEKRHAKLLKQQAEQQAALKQFATLDSDFEVVKGALKAHKEAYQQYIANEKIAQTRQARQQTVLVLHDAHAKQKKRQNKLAGEHAFAALNYDAEQHEEIKERAQATNERVVELRTQLDAAKSQLSQAQRELTELQKQQEALKAAEKEVSRYKHLSEAFRFVRDGIRQAGPAVVQRRVRLISHQADHIFQDILEEASFSLSWDESYAISIHHRGEVRDYQQLSGGEQMAAAIAVRLALLMQMSQIRLLFLDEPTTNLDDRRRDRLANRMTQLDGLRQVFIITHDDVFERDTHHVLRVRKEDGVSLVEVR